MENFVTLPSGLLYPNTLLALLLAHLSMTCDYSECFSALNCTVENQRFLKRNKVSFKSRISTQTCCWY